MLSFHCRYAPVYVSLLFLIRLKGPSYGNSNIPYPRQSRSLRRVQILNNLRLCKGCWIRSSLLQSTIISLYSASDLPQVAPLKPQTPPCFPIYSQKPRNSHSLCSTSSQHSPLRETSRFFPPRCRRIQAQESRSRSTAPP